MVRFCLLTLPDEYHVGSGGTLSGDVDLKLNNETCDTVRLQRVVEKIEAVISSKQQKFRSMWLVQDGGYRSQIDEADANVHQLKEDADEWLRKMMEKHRLFTDLRPRRAALEAEIAKLVEKVKAASVHKAESTHHCRVFLLV
jgi:hypothetical protein